jgi:hypothetical protein
MSGVAVLAFVVATLLSCGVFAHLHCVYTSAVTFTLSFATVAAALTHHLHLI